MNTRPKPTQVKVFRALPGSQPEYELVGVSKVAKPPTTAGGSAIVIPRQ